MRRGHKTGIKPIYAALVTIVLCCAGVYMAFAKSVPFRHHYEIQAVFTNSNLVKSASPVRIAGVNVGKVVSVTKYKDTSLSLVTMQIDPRGRPIHADATMKVRPRLFLEGNFYVDLKPGTPSAKDLPDRGLIPVTQTAAPVQLDQVLTALDANVRGSLQKALQGFGAALDGAPTADDDARHPSVKGLTGAQSLNKTLDTSPSALRGSAVVSTALLGPRPHDLSATVDGFARATKALAANDVQLRDLVGHFDTTMSAFAAQAPALEQTVKLLGPTSASARAAFTSLAGAIPATRQFARDLAPGVAETPATITASDPWLAQAKPLLSKAELGGLLDDISPATRNLASLGYQTRRFLPKIDAFNQCITKVFLPTGNIKVADGAQTSGVENYKEFWYGMTGLAGTAQGFDGNGPMLRLAAAGGANTIELGATNYQGNSQPLFANPTLSPQATKPAFPNKLPPLRRDVACATQKVPDVNGPAASGPADGAGNLKAPAVQGEPGVTLAARAGATLAALTGGGR